MTYTDEGWRKSIANQLNKITTTSYDKKGRPVTIINPKLRVKTLTYDALDRVVTIQYADTTRVTYGYDALSRRVTMQDSGGNTTYAYSKRGELTDQTLPGSLRLHSVGNRTTLTDPDSGVFTYVFDARNMVVTVTDPSSGSTTISYDAAGRRSGMKLPNGSKRAYSYDAASRLTTQIESTSASAPFMTMVDTYDNVGNRTKRVKDGVTTTWTMDNAYRLIGQEVASGFVTMSYDTRGNIVSKWQQGTNPMTFTLDAANQMVTMLQGSTKTTYAYDANGNLISEQTPLGPITPWSYTYDDEDLLTLEKQTNVAPNPLSTYTYSGDGLRRTAFPASGALTTFVWDGSDYLGEY